MSTRNCEHEGEIMAVFKKADRKLEYAEGVEGGTGIMIRDRCELGDKVGGVCTYMVCNSLEPGASIGEHTHTGELRRRYPKGRGITQGVSNKKGQMKAIIWPGILMVPATGIEPATH